MSAADGREGARPRARAALVAWVLFDWAAQPYFTLITTFVFAPYFVAHVLATPVEGQAIWGLAVGLGGAGVAVLSPLLGAVADAGGPRKPWIAAASVALIAGACALWWAAPGAPSSAPSSVWPIVLALVVASLGAEIATVFTNAMLPDVAAPERIGRVSGLGWAVGYVGGLAALALMLGAVLTDPASGLTLAGLAPLVGGGVPFAGDRLSGPFAALWYAIFVIPLFLLVPDRPRRARLGAAIVDGLAGLRATLARLFRRGPMARYLVAHMLYVDGLAALFSFGAAYAASTFAWNAVEVGLFGIILIVAATVGASIGGRLDDRFGPRRLILAGLVLLAVSTLLLLSVGRDHVLFALGVVPAADGGLFSSWPERVYVAGGSLIGMAAGPVQSASRTLLVRLAPRGELTEYFGLYALSGKATAFLGPFLIGAVTAASGSQRLGISVILLFFAIGFLVLRGVREA